MTNFPMPVTASSSPADVRLSQLKEWLASLTATPLRPDSLRPASADASFRRYFRLDAVGGGTLIAMDAPPPQENVRPSSTWRDCWPKPASRCRRSWRRTCERGFLLLSDLGSTTYLHQLNADSAHQLYSDAIDALLQMQAHSQPGVLPEYDRALRCCAS